MKLLYQPTVANPGGWRELDSSQWRSYLASVKKPIPVGGEVINGAPGWMHSLNIQGCGFGHPDHWAVEDLRDGRTKVTVWKDDPGDRPSTNFTAAECFFEPIIQRPEQGAHGGPLNPRQTMIVYASEDAYAEHAAMPRVDVTLKRWKDFKPPPEALTIHAVTVHSDLHLLHESLRPIRGWREWIEGIPLKEIRGGLIRDQREPGRWWKPDGTRTYILRDTARTNGVHAADNENASELGTATVGTLTTNNLGHGADTDGFSWISPANEPNSTAWPTGNYRCVFDVSANGDIPNMNFGLRNTGGSTGHFGRMNAARTTDIQTHQQTEGFFTGTGVKTGTTGSVAWSTGNADEVFECVIVVARLGSIHGNATISIDVNRAGDLCDGPWTAASTAARRRVNLLNRGGMM